MKILLLEEWMDNPSGMTMDLVPQKAIELISRGVARDVTTCIEFPSKTEGKAIEEPNKDRMMKRRVIK